MKTRWLTIQCASFLPNPTDFMVGGGVVNVCRAMQFIKSPPDSRAERMAAGKPPTCTAMPVGFVNPSKPKALWIPEN